MNNIQSLHQQLPLHSLQLHELRQVLHRYINLNTEHGAAIIINKSKFSII